MLRHFGTEVAPHGREACTGRYMGTQSSMCSMCSMSVIVPFDEQVNTHAKPDVNKRPLRVAREVRDPRVADVDPPSCPGKRLFAYLAGHCAEHVVVRWSTHEGPLCDAAAEVPC